ncbi:MAG: zinc ribbon domain-containing protein [Lachnospiraceae bacterium]|nr:zinc ribbon domain-containing protein [Lachnospiraceae bacterium]
MICPICKNDIPDGTNFCPNCGARLVDDEISINGAPRREAEETVEIQGVKVTENITLCDDGKYRWYYEFHMMKNPTIFLTVLKVLGMAAAIVAAFSVIISLKDWIKYGFQFEEGGGKILLIFLAVFLGITIISYIIVAALYGWKYLVLFEMDEEGVTHVQLPKQMEKAQALGLITALIGLASNKPTTAGIGLLAAARSASTSEFEKVRKVKCRKGLQTIFVNYRLDHNQVYAKPADFDFVKEYIVSRCVNAKIIG